MSNNTRTVICGLDQKQLVMFLAMAVKANGGSMSFPRELFNSMPDTIEIYVSRGSNDEVTLHIGDPTCENVEDYDER